MLAARDAQRTASEALGKQDERVRGKLQKSDSERVLGCAPRLPSLGTRSWPLPLPFHPGDPSPPLRRLTCPRGVRVRSAPPPYQPDRWHQRPDPETPPPGWRGWRRSGPAPGNHTPHCRRRPLVQCPPLPAHWQMALATMLEGFQGGGRHWEAKARALEQGAAPGAGWKLALCGVFSYSTPGAAPPQCDSQHPTVALRIPRVLPGCGPRVFEPLKPRSLTTQAPGS